METIPILRETHLSSAKTEDKPKTTKGRQRGFKVVMVGNTALAFCLLSYTFAIITSQVALEKINIFEINTIRFTIQVLLSLAAILVGNESIIIERKHVRPIFGVVASDYVYSNCYFLAASFMPVGNMDGVFGAIYIIIALTYDLYCKRITKYSIVAAAIACVGIILLVQPWMISDAKEFNQDIIPCDYLDNKTTQNLWNSTEGSLNLDKEEEHVKQYILGYVLVFVSAAFVTVSGNLSIPLLQNYGVATVTFWAGLIEGFLSVLVTVIWKSATASSYALPSGFYCLLFVLLFAVFAALENIFSNWTYFYLPISKVALGMPFATVLCYIAQRTVFKTFHPGHANITEVFGIVLSIAGAILSPIMSLLFEEKN